MDILRRKQKNTDSGNRFLEIIQGKQNPNTYN
jgi:hypothetical protein